MPLRRSAGTKAIGIDVSRFQGGDRLANRLRPRGIRFAFVQASRGSGADCTVKPAQCGPDPYFATNRLAAESVRDPRRRVPPRLRERRDGRRRARADALAEANIFIAAVGSLQSGELIPVLDAESPFTGMTSTSLRTWIRVFVKRVTKQLGRKPMIYTNASSWSATGNTVEFAKARYPLWVAEWGVSQADRAGEQLGAAAATRSGSTRARAASRASRAVSTWTGSASGLGKITVH